MFKNLFTKIEKNRIRLLKRYTPFKTYVFYSPIKAVDKSSFLYMYDEIFEKEIYKFKSSRKNPYIIDAGSNIGLSIIYFKKKYPNSKILGFEPDRNIFKILEDNLKSLKLTDVEIIEKGLSNQNGQVLFYSEGSDGGRIKQETDKGTYEIKTTKLSTFIKDKVVDFLKIDIEGSEYDVIEESKEHLKNIENIFIEYHSYFNKPQKLHNILEILSKNGFRYYIENVGVKSTNPFMHINKYMGYDNQINISAKKI